MALTKASRSPQPFFEKASHKRLHICELGDVNALEFLYVMQHDSPFDLSTLDLNDLSVVPRILHLTPIKDPIK